MYRRIKDLYKKVEDKFDLIPTERCLKKNKFNIFKFLRKKYIVMRGMELWKSPHIYLSLKCNLRCSYCSNGKFYDKSNMGYRSKSKEFWIKKLNSIKNNSIIFTGGEPLLYKDLFEIISNLHQIHVTIYSNLSIKNFESLLTLSKKKCNWRISYHPGGGSNLRTLLRNIHLLKVRNEPFQLFIVPTEVNKDLINLRTRSRLKKHNIDLNYMNSVQKHLNIRKKKVRCLHKRYFYAPDGNRYHCVYGIITKNPEYIVNHNRLEDFKICENYGECSPCDQAIKIKVLD